MRFTILVLMSATVIVSGCIGSGNDVYAAEGENSEFEVTVLEGS